MGTRNNPSSHDCYANAHPDEPMFVLLGRDPVGSLLVRLWAGVRTELGETSEEKLGEAYSCADDMGRWAIGLGKSVAIAKAALHVVLLRRAGVNEETMREARARELEALAEEVSGSEFGVVSAATLRDRADVIRRGEVP